MYKRIVSFGLAVFFLAGLNLAARAADLTLDEIAGKLKGSQQKIKDMYAETYTKISSNLQIPGSDKKGPQNIEQKGKLWTKGEGKSKMEMLSPMKQITVTNGDKMMVVNPDSGQKMVQDLKKMREKSGASFGGDAGGQMSLEKAKEYFDLSAKADGGGYVLTGIPKKANNFLGKMEFYLDSDRWVPKKICMYDSKGKIISQSEIEYKEISGIFVPSKTKSQIMTPMGKMDVEMQFNNIKINQGIDDKEFRIE